MWSLSLISYLPYVLPCCICSLPFVVPNSSTLPAVTQGYRRTALLLHPDKNLDPLADKAFTRVRRAFEVLSNPRRRLLFDTRGEEGPQQSDSQNCSPTALGAKDKDGKSRRLSQLRHSSVTLTESLPSVHFDSPSAVRSQSEKQPQRKGKQPKPVPSTSM
eukprot:NODE_345_length_1873_cov_53.131579_g289_i0.p1 GENE.NODE_345_length_1873_cov_53.131579_g289_i0~~NODE_345_length_1873_cov_53.131579_g289_i0.p1  ORF type:complete len:160 (+),score=32.98 NODE_345_length_1873_cov_53.131579_g289_i0:1042-1521(+)